jgi:hypothetical protein
MKATLFPLIRHALTVGAGYLIGAGYFDSGASDEIVAGIMALIAVVWSHFEKRPPADNGTPVALVIGILSLSMFSAGCNSLNPSGPYKGDTVLYGADKGITEGYEALRLFVKWEYDNRAALEPWPEIRAGADYVRENAQLWVSTAQALRDTYAANPSHENKDKLLAALAVLRSALAQTAVYMKEAK